MYDNIRVSFPSHAEFDITNPDSMLHYIQNRDIACIINCAAYTDVNSAQTDPAAWVVNVDSIYNLVNLCSSNNIFLTHISTDYVFDGSPYVKTEDDIDMLSPVNIYGLTKFRGENIIRNTYSNLKNYCIIRTSWLYSKYRNNFVKTIIGKLLANTTDFSWPVKVVQDQIGSPTYAMDLADFIVKNYIVEFTLDNPEPKSGIYHFSNLGAISWYDFAVGIKDTLSKYSTVYDLKDIVPVSTQDLNAMCPRPKISIMSKDKVIRRFHWEIPYWQHSLNKFMSDYISEINFL